MCIRVILAVRNLMMCDLGYVDEPIVTIATLRAPAPDVVSSEPHDDGTLFRFTSDFRFAYCEREQAVTHAGRAAIIDRHLIDVNPWHMVTVLFLGFVYALGSESNIFMRLHSSSRTLLQISTELCTWAMIAGSMAGGGPHRLRHSIIVEWRMT